MAIRGFMVYLDDEDPEDQPVIELLDKKAARRRASTTIRDALLAWVRGVVPAAIPVAIPVNRPAPVVTPAAVMSPPVDGQDVVSKAKRAFLR